MVALTIEQSMLFFEGSGSCCCGGAQGHQSSSFIN